MEPGVSRLKNELYGLSRGSEFCGDFREPETRRTTAPPGANSGEFGRTYFETPPFRESLEASGFRAGEAVVTKNGSCTAAAGGEDGAGVAR